VYRFLAREWTWLLPPELFADRFWSICRRGYVVPDPDRIFRVSCALARQVGWWGVWRVLDSAPLGDAVATQDAVRLLRG
jgi:hypothetical protein